MMLLTSDLPITRMQLTPPDAAKVLPSLVAWNIAASTGVERYGETWRRKVVFSR